MPEWRNGMLAQSVVLSPLADHSKEQEMQHRAKIILAYDRDTFDPGDIRLLREIRPYIDMVKVGLQAMTSEVGEEPNVGATAASLVRDFLQDRDEFKQPVPVMWDMKLKDIEHTVSAALRNIVGWN